MDKLWSKMISSEIFLAVAALLFLCVYNFKRRKLYVLSSKLSGPSAFPLIGCYHHFIGAKSLKEFKKSFDFTKFGIFRLWLGPKLYLLINNSEDIQLVLNSNNCINKDQAYDRLQDLYGDGDGFFKKSGRSLFISPHHHWKENRKLLNPCFSVNVIRKFNPKMNELSEVLVENLRGKVGNGAFNIWEYAVLCSLDMIVETSMGVKRDLQKNNDFSYVFATAKMFDLVYKRVLKIWLQSNFIFKRTKYYKVHVTESKTMSDFQKSILDEKIEMLKDVQDDEDKDVFLNKLVHTLKENKIHYDAAYGELTTTLIAGNETTALTISIVCLMLAIHPEVQEKVFQEIYEVFSEKKIEASYDDLMKLNYLDMVIKETLRLYPSGPYIARTVSSPMELSNLHIPSGVSLIIPIFNIQRDKKIWGPDADLFNPDNFLPEKVQSRHPYSYCPFSGGYRMCIGYKYATMTIKTVLIHLLRNYKFSTELKMKEIRLKIDLTLKIMNKPMVSIEEREF